MIHAKHFARVAVVGVALALSAPAAFAQANAAPAAAAPSVLTPGQQALTGYWGTWKRFLGTMATGKPKQTGQDDLLAAAAKSLPWAKEKRDKQVADDAAGVFVPSPTTMCLPDVIANAGVYDAYGIYVVVEPHQVSFMHEAGRVMRFIHIDQQHPADLQPGWLGHSVGHWEGDTLVVDTIGFNGLGALPQRIPMTDKMHVVERIRVVDGVLEDVATFDDPGAFSGPFTVTTRFDPSQPFQEYICAENNHEGGVPTSKGTRTGWTLTKGAAK